MSEHEVGKRTPRRTGCAEDCEATFPSKLSTTSLAEIGRYEDMLAKEIAPSKRKRKLRGLVFFEDSFAPLPLASISALSSLTRFDGEHRGPHGRGRPKAMVMVKGGAHFLRPFGSKHTEKSLQT